MSAPRWPLDSTYALRSTFNLHLFVVLMLYEVCYADFFDVAAAPSFG